MSTTSGSGVGLDQLEGAVLDALAPTEQGLSGPLGARIEAANSGALTASFTGFLIDDGYLPTPEFLSHKDARVH